jgi:hypothetical protein
VSPGLLGTVADPAEAASSIRPPDVGVRAVLTNYAATGLVPLLGLVALLTGWTLSAADGWPAAVAAVGTFAAGTAAWLRRRTWSPGLVHPVTWGAPAALLLPSAAAGLLSADGLVLWAPMTTVLAVWLTLTYEPRPVSGRRGHTG